MTLRELHYLTALADHGHFGKAAEACCVSQPTLSTQLKKLEEHLNVVLFERTNKTLRITPLGEQIVARARRVLAEADAIFALARTQTATLSGPLNLGVIPTLGPYLLPWVLPSLSKTYPQLRLIVHEDLTDHLLERLKTHRIDAALLALPVEATDLEVQALFDEPFFFACPTDHPLAAVQKVRMSALREARLLLLTDGHCLRQQALAVCGLRQAPVEEAGTDFRATSLETIRQMVIAGMGCTLLPAMALDKRRDRSLQIRPLFKAASRRIGLVWRKNYFKEADLKRLAGTICDNLPAGVQPV